MAKKGCNLKAFVVVTIVPNNYNRAIPHRMMCFVFSACLLHACLVHMVIKLFVTIVSK